MRKIALLLAFVLMGLIGWLGVQNDAPQPGDTARRQPAQVDTPARIEAFVAERVDGPGATLAARTGSKFLPAPADPYRSPRFRVIDLPQFAGANSIWGATGRDRRGHIWFGVSVKGGRYSARLFEYDPILDRVFERGDAVSNLIAAGIHKNGERQMTLHSRIVQADDGYLYFTTTDEQGVALDGSSLPKWGSHLWRLYPGENRWEHLRQVPEGLTALAGGGRWVYALGLWDHVLYQYDTATGVMNSVTVGATGGHISRNFIADLRGHVFVPRVTPEGAALVELDSHLREIAETPLRGYVADGRPDRSHGITGLVYLADGSMAFSLHHGSLYRILPQEQGPSFVEPLGPFNPADPNYSPSLFTFAGKRFLVGLANRTRANKHDHQRYVWLVYDLENDRAQRVAFPLEGQALLYGSITRDQQGRFYVAGRRNIAGEGNRPLLIQIDTGQ